MVIGTLIPTDKAKQLLSSGCTDPEIAKALGFTAGSVSKWRRRHHLQSNGIQGRQPKYIKTKVINHAENT